MSLLYDSAYRSWSGWKYFPSSYPSYIWLYLNQHYERGTSMEIANLQNSFDRLKFHRLAELFGLRTESRGNHYERIIYLSCPNAWKPTRPDPLTRDPFASRKRDRWEDYAESCDNCQVSRDEAFLGASRNGSVLCEECWEDDDELSKYKFAPLDL